MQIFREVNKLADSLPQMPQITPVPPCCFARCESIARRVRIIKPSTAQASIACGQGSSFDLALFLMKGTIMKLHITVLASSLALAMPALAKDIPLSRRSR